MGEIVELDRGLRIYSKYPGDVDWFDAMVEEFPGLEFFLPSPDKAPWHVQVEVDGKLLNIWPHVCKAMWDYEPPTVIGAANIEAMIVKQREVGDTEDFDLFE